MSDKMPSDLSSGKTTSEPFISNILGGQSENPEDFTIAGAKLLRYNGNAERVKIPDGVKEISVEAFKDKDFITCLVLPVSVKLIREDAFLGCKGLNRLEYTGTLKEWCEIEYKNGYSGPLWYARNLYIGGQKITNLVVPEGLKTLKYDAFAGGEFESITLPQGFETVGWGSFCNNYKLTKIVLPPSVKKILDWGYYYTGVKEFIAPETLGYIGGNAFNTCNNLACVFLPKTVNFVGENAFFGCKNAVIYCEAPFKPDAWHQDWNVLDKDGNRIKVIWNA